MSSDPSLQPRMQESTATANSGATVSNGAKTDTLESKPPTPTDRPTQTTSETTTTTCPPITTSVDTLRMQQPSQRPMRPMFPPGGPLPRMEAMFRPGVPPNMPYGAPVPASYQYPPMDSYYQHGYSGPPRPGFMPRSGMPGVPPGHHPSFGPMPPGFPQRMMRPPPEPDVKPRVGSMPTTTNGPGAVSSRSSPQPQATSPSSSSQPVRISSMPMRSPSQVWDGHSGMRPPVQVMQAPNGQMFYRYFNPGMLPGAQPPGQFYGHPHYRRPGPQPNMTGYPGMPYINPKMGAVAPPSPRKKRRKVIKSPESQSPTATPTSNQSPVINGESKLSDTSSPVTAHHTTSDPTEDSPVMQTNS